ncbi:MAG TPA: hypothetical protein GXX28_02005, partial [Firmicutes bacterium]|nr:hypothetical protein [Bacillota bacterium]
MRVGVPRALLFWSYAPLWLSVLRRLGAEPVVSGATTRATLDAGVKLAVEEVCLPVKVFYGHCAALAAAGVEALFVPRLVAVEPRAYICPKFMGLPDMVRHALGGRSRVLSPVVDLRRRASGYVEAVAALAAELGVSRRLAGLALAAGTTAQEQAEMAWERGHLPPAVLGDLESAGEVHLEEEQPPGRAPAGRRVAVLGHP